LGAYASATECATCGVPLESVALAAAGEAPQVFVYRPWVPWVLGVLAVAFPFLPIPFLGGVAGFGMKIMASVALIKIIRDYRSSMR
jgi:hypothetical protein